MKRELTKAEQKFVDSLAEQLPPCLARTELRKRLGGMVSPYTVRNYDDAGQGPEGTYRVGKRVVYLTRPLLEWLVLRLGVTPVIRLDQALAPDEQRPAA